LHRLQVSVEVFVQEGVLPVYPLGNQKGEVELHESEHLRELFIGGQVQVVFGHCDEAHHLQLQQCLRERVWRSCIHGRFGFCCILIPQNPNFDVFLVSSLKILDYSDLVVLNLNQ